MKVRDTSQGRMYAVSSAIGCTAINGAMAVDIPAGGQAVILALDKKLIIDGDDAAKFVEVRWGTNAAVGSSPAPSWIGDVVDGLVSIVGADKFDVNYFPIENKLVVHTDRVSDELSAEVTELLERTVPQDVEVEQYNHHIEISWRDINKYAECVSYVDLYNVNPDYGNDLTSDGEWVYPLPNLVTASAFAPGSISVHEKCLFAYNTNLKKWNVDLPKAKSVTNMFRGASLNEFNGALPVVSSMGNGENKMFGGNGLQIFRSSNCGIQDGTKWFWYCESFHTFDADLSKLYTGYHMFAFAILNKKSALRIFNSIPTFTSGSHPLSIGIHVDHKTDEEVLAAIANAESKGWTLSVQWNGKPTSTASTMAMGQLIYAKVAEHELPDGTTERVLDWGHYVTNWEARGYEQFRSLESAYEYFNLPMPGSETEE